MIRRAGPAAVELCEELWSRDGPTEIALDIIFDEFRLTIDIGWAEDDRHLNGSEFDRLVGHLQRRYDCRAKLQADSQSRLMRFTFDH